MTRTLVLLAVVACSEPRGLLVTTDDNVQLFIALSAEDCFESSECPITPPDPADRTKQGVKVNARRWLLDDDKPIVVHGGGELIQSSTGEDQIIQALLAVELDGSGKPSRYALVHQQVVPANDAREIEIHPNIAASTLQLWTPVPDDGLTPCAIADTHGTPQFESFSRAGDEDCDAAVPECDPFAVFGSHIGPVTDNAMNCAFSAPGAEPKCGLGGETACRDGVDAGTCEPNLDAWCLPSGYCEAATACQVGDSSCYQQILGSTTVAGPVVACQFPGIDAATCRDPLVEASLDFDEPTDNFAADGLGCGELKISAITSPFAFADKVTTPSGAVVSLSSFDGNACSAHVAITRPIDSTKPAAALLALGTANGSHRHRVFPIVVGYNPSLECGQPGKCALFGASMEPKTASMYTCVP